MECPNCGAEMKEGSLYCEHCGEDIHIVPDFEPELEFNMEQNLEQIRENVVVETEGLEDGKDARTTKSQRRRASGRKSFSIGFFCILGTVLVILFGMVKLFQHFSVEYQVKCARRAVGKEQYESAIRYYSRAIELDQLNTGFQIDLADVYFLKNDKAEYERLLIKIVQDPNTDAQMLESVYGKLITIYRARGDHQMINDVLLACGNDSVKAVYRTYLAEPVQFSIPGGNYDEVEALKLNVTGQGDIYYTMDGSDPTKDSTRYMTPILLENGDYLIKAIFVNENGVVSEMAVAQYHIDAEELEAPKLNMESGEYSVPIMIAVVGDAEDVYYTMDGTAPTLNSPRYTDPVPVPLGVSKFQFARLRQGRGSMVVERDFELTLDTDFTPKQAVSKIAEYALRTEKIRDGEGHFDDTAAVYQYQYLYAVNIRDINDFYVVAEVLVDAQGISAKTGNYYAVNAYTGYYYKLQINNGIYTLVELTQ